MKIKRYEITASEIYIDEDKDGEWIRWAEANQKLKYANKALSVALIEIGMAINWLNDFYPKGVELKDGKVVIK